MEMVDGDGGRPSGSIAPEQHVDVPKVLPLGERATLEQRVAANDHLFKGRGVRVRASAAQLPVRRIGREFLLQRLRVLLRAAAAKCEVYRGDFHAEKGRDRKRRRNGF